MSRGFLQLHLHLGDLRGNISAWELYFDSFNAAVICADRHGPLSPRPISSAMRDSPREFAVQEEPP